MVTSRKHEENELVLTINSSRIQDLFIATVGIVVVARDITEKHQPEQEHVKLNKLESCGVLAGGIAHLRRPSDFDGERR